jgi:hypothetical protein
MTRAAKVPAYCLHKHSRQAIVYIDGRAHYLGPTEAPKATRSTSARSIAEWRVVQQERAAQANGAARPPTSPWLGRLYIGR